MHHCLLVLRPVVGQVVANFFERLPDARDVAMPEDTEHAAEHALLDAISLQILV